MGKRLTSFYINLLEKKRLTSFPFFQIIAITDKIVVKYTYLHMDGFRSDNKPILFEIAMIRKNGKEVNLFLY